MFHLLNITKNTLFLLQISVAVAIVMVTYTATAQAAPLFEEPVSYEVAAFYDLGVEDWGGQVLDTVVADFNNDGFLDIAGTYQDGSTPSADYDTPAGTEGVAILLNDGDGTFTISSYVSYPGDMLSIVAADFDGDGDIDLITANSGSGDLSILSNDSEGNFSELQRFGENLDVESVAVADFDSDGDYDIATTDYDIIDSDPSYMVSPGVQIFINDGNGNFSLGLPILVNSDGFTRISDLVASDIDDDGDQDIVAGSGNGVVIYMVARNNGDASFVSEETTLPISEKEFSDLASIDFDNDGDIDVLGNLGGGQEVVLFLNNGEDGLVSEQINLGISLDGYARDTLTVTDFDADGDDDLVEVNNGINEIYLLTNDGFGTYTSETIQSLVYGGFTSVNVGDLNNDGGRDIVISTQDNPGKIVVILQTYTGGQTSEEQAAQLIIDVIALDIPNNLENSYLANLFKVEGFISSGLTTPAVNQLNAFINKVNQDYNQGKITQQMSDDLVSAAQQLIDDLTS